MSLVRSPARPIFLPRTDDSHCDRIHSSLAAAHCFDNGYVGKQLVAWKEYCVEYWVREFQECMDSCTGHRDITAILLKQTIYINQLSIVALIMDPLIAQNCAIDRSATSVVITHRQSVSVSPSVRRPSIHNFLVNTPASTNIYQSAPNLVKMYMTIRSWMSCIMELIGPELSKLSAFGLEKLPYLTVYTRGSTYKDHLAPNFGKTFMSNRI